MVPTINGTMHHFNNVGLYDALFVMQDTESKTLWNHITGEALYGPLVGRTLGPLKNVLQMNVRQALEMDPKMPVAISDRPYFAGGKPFGSAPGLGGGRGAAPARGAGPGRAAGGRGAPGNPNATLSEMFVQTLGKEDVRRPRMDMGLGIWTETLRRYYPMDRIREREGALIDQVGRKKVLVYIDPETSAPAALFVEAKSAKLEGKEVRLDDGTIIRSGMLIDRRGQRKQVERAQQVFTRWYGFALTFPGCEVFGG